MRRACFADQRIDLDVGIIAGERMALCFDDNARAVAAQDLATVGWTGAECVETFVVPAQQRVLCRSTDGDRVQRDVVALADAIESADALLEQVRIERQIPQDQLMRELEIATLRSDLRAQQHARAVGFGEPGRVAITLQDRHAFVEACNLDSGFHAQRFFEREHFRLCAADQQEFVARVPLDQGDEPGQTWIRRKVVLAGRWTRLRISVEFGEQMLARRVVELVAVQHGDIGDSARKSADLSSAVAEHHAAGAVAVDQRIDECRRGRSAFAGVTVEQREQVRVVGENTRKLVASAAAPARRRRSAPKRARTAARSGRSRR